MQWAEVNRTNPDLLSYIAGPVTNKFSYYVLYKYKYFRSSTTQSALPKVVKHERTGELSSLWVWTICSQCLPRLWPADQLLRYIFSYMQLLLLDRAATVARWRYKSVSLLLSTRNGKEAQCRWPPASTIFCRRFSAMCDSDRGSWRQHSNRFGVYGWPSYSHFVVSGVYWPPVLNIRRGSTEDVRVPVYCDAVTSCWSITFRNVANH